MTYAVVWMATAVRQLGQIAAAATDPRSVQQAADWVDYTLRRAPSDMGESRGGNERVWYGDVLGVYYEVDDATTTVRILLVGPARRR
jgi:mRNA-degrading endonuclease RelE of RelBE toxin-antitoxin system